MPRKNEWQSRYGARRKAIDRALLAECERTLGLEEAKGPLPAKNGQRPSAVNSEAPGDDARAAIARAFGRPVH